MKQFSHPTVVIEMKAHQKPEKRPFMKGSGFWPIQLVVRFSHSQKHTLDMLTNRNMSMMSGFKDFIARRTSLAPSEILTSLTMINFI